MVVTSAVSSFGDETTAETAVEALYEDIGECTHFEDVSEDGTETTVIDVTVDTDAATDEVDDQFAMVGGGTWTFAEQAVPLGVGFSVARVDNNVTMVMLLCIGVEEDSELLAPYTEIAADRLVAVAAGETPEVVAAPPPTAAPTARLPVPVPGRWRSSSRRRRGSSATTDRSWVPAAHGRPRTSRTFRSPTVTARWDGDAAEKRVRQLGRRRGLTRTPSIATSTSSTTPRTRTTSRRTRC